METVAIRTEMGWAWREMSLGAPQLQARRSSRICALDERFVRHDVDFVGWATQVAANNL
ncbi:MAG: hypothetical protein ACYDD1_20815 [Caulobacteraceae bacterium]